MRALPKHKEVPLTLRLSEGMSQPSSAAKNIQLPFLEKSPLKCASMYAIDALQSEVVRVRVTAQQASSTAPIRQRYMI